MLKGPEILTFEPRNKRRLLRPMRQIRYLASQVLEYCKTAPLIQKVSAGFTGFVIADGVQIVVNRMIVHIDPMPATVEIISGMGTLLASHNLFYEAPKARWLHIINGTAGAAGITASILAKTGNPDLFLPALAIATSSMIIGGITTKRPNE